MGKGGTYFAFCISPITACLFLAAAKPRKRQILNVKGLEQHWFSGGQVKASADRESEQDYRERFVGCSEKPSIPYMFSFYVQRKGVELLPLPAQFARIQAAGVANGREENWLFNRQHIKLVAEEPFHDDDQWFERNAWNREFDNEAEIPVWALDAKSYTCARTGETSDRRKLFGHWSYASNPIFYESSEEGREGRNGKSRIFMLSAARHVSY